MHSSKILVAFVCLLNFSECKKILAICAFPVHSHYIYMERILDKLSERGHEITVISPSKVSNSNFTKIYLSGLSEGFEEKRTTLLNYGKLSVFSKIMKAYEIAYWFTENAVKSHEISEFLKQSQHFDAVILDQFLHDSFLGFAHHFKSPVIYTCSFGTNIWSNHYVNNPSPLSYIPHKFAIHSGKMTFLQRLQNLINSSFEELYRRFVALPKFNKWMKTIFPNAPNLNELMYQDPLLLLNTHYSTHNAIPLMPNMIEVAGAHLKENPLPEDLKKFLDDSTNGVILFSLGSIIRSSNLTNPDVFLKVFGKLKQNVLWKWENDQLPKSTDNVKFAKWLPQFDVLAHKNVKAFISHGGLLSSIEAVHQGVPIVGIPIFGDQNVNIKFLQSKGMAIYVNYLDLAEISLEKAILQVLNDEQFKINAVRRSELFRERDMKPLDKAVYWVEHVLKYGKLSEMRSHSMDLLWYQKEMVDVAAFLLFLIAIVAFLVIKMCKKNKIKVD
ncbi:PREDICTED: UDP-glucuronosyltransferase 2B31-like [Nicrophorus vespilloides]|uniref:UDP-glucuronosyltransferase n=1 Tax=Nicrophorus vespilloides TaxID=110193 RepID=A0ABM1M324_NICVS|nr:PREDICTED: UDP-glucuronosyltransferase 2B31-like [Nicrophorus vespilloides]